MTAVLRGRVPHGVGLELPVVPYPVAAEDGLPLPAVVALFLDKSRK
jgi:hypothetical protein